MIELAPVTHFSLGSHGEENLRAIPAVCGQLQDYLEQGYTVMYFLERAQTTQETSDLILSLQNKGYSPSDAYTVGLFVSSYGKFPTIAEEVAYKEKVLADEPFKKAELEMLDDLTNNHKGKILLLVEGQTDEEINTVPDDYIDGGKAFRDVTIPLLCEGKFDKALEFFQESVRALYVLTSSRNESDKRNMSTHKREGSVIYSRRGRSHSFLARSMKQEGENVIVDFDNKKSGMYLFDYYETVTRLYSQFGEQITEFEWYKGMMGFLLTHIEDSFYRNTFLGDRGYLDDQVRVLGVRAYIEGSFCSMEDVRSFEKQIREDGFEQALVNFMKIDK